MRIALTSSNLAEGDSGEVVHQFTVTRSGVLTGTTTVDWALYAQSLGPDADDFVTGQNGLNNVSGLPSGTITFAPSETSKVIEVRTKGDTGIENTEAFYIALGNASNSADIHRAANPRRFFLKLFIRVSIWFNSLLKFNVRTLW